MSRLLFNLFPGTVDHPPLNGVAVFIIGEQLNPRLTDKERLACTGEFMLSICTLAGFPTHTTYLRAACMRRNLFRPGQVLCGKLMAENALIMLEHFNAYQEFYGDEVKERQILLCGAWARNAFAFTGAYGRQANPGGACTWIPHPSGRNKFYEDPVSRDRVARLVQLVFAHAL